MPFPLAKWNHPGNLTFPTFLTFVFLILPPTVCFLFWNKPASSHKAQRIYFER